LNCRLAVKPPEKPVTTRCCGFAPLLANSATRCRRITPLQFAAVNVIFKKNQDFRFEAGNFGWITLRRDVRSSESEHRLQGVDRKLPPARYTTIRRPRRSVAPIEKGTPFGLWVGRGKTMWISQKTLGILRG